MTKYTLCISDGSSLDGGGVITFRGRLRDARAAWRRWAEAGDYTTADGSDVRVSGSIVRGDGRGDVVVVDMSTTARSTVAS